MPLKYTKNNLTAHTASDLFFNELSEDTILITQDIMRGTEDIKALYYAGD